MDKHSEDFEEIRTQLHEQGYHEKDVTITSGKAMILGVFYALPCCRTEEWMKREYSGFMRNKMLKRAAGILLACGLNLVSLTGCGNGQGFGTKLVLTTGFDRDEIFRIETSTCSLPEIMVYLTNIQNRYESVYGPEI